MPPRDSMNDKPTHRLRREGETVEPSLRERLEALGHGVLEPTGKGVVMVPTGDQQVPQC